MQIQTEKERSEKTTRNAVIIFVIGGLIYLEMYMLHYMTLKNMYKRATFSQLTSQVNSHMFTNFTEIQVSSGDMFSSFLIVTVISLVLVYLYINRKLRKADNPDTVNGEARLMTLRDIKEFNKRRNSPYGEKLNNGPDNMILSKDIMLGMDGYRTRRNQNTIVVGASGAGKSRFFAAPNILQYNSNFVITDPSGELLRAYGKGLEDNGYKVKILNLTDPYNSNHYNPFHYIKEEKDVFIVVNSIIKNTSPEGKSGGDPFFDDAANLLLSALMLLMWHTYDKEQQTLAELVTLLNLGTINENDGSAVSPLDRKFEELRTRDEYNLALKQYDSFKLGGAKTLKSVLITASTRLRIFSLADIAHLTAYDDMHFETFNDSKQALFVIIPTADTTFNAIVSLMYSQLFTTLYRYGEQRVAFSWNLVAGNEHFKTFQAANDTQSKKAHAKAIALSKEIKAGTKLAYDRKKKLWFILTKKNKVVVGWRGKKKWAQEFQEALKDVKVEKGDSDGRAPNHTRFILDEFANISQMPDFEKLVATMRKYNISVDIIIQALSQLKAIYKDHWNDIIGNCDTKLVLGCEDTETLKWIIEVQGKKTTTVENTSIGDGNKFSTSLNKSSLEIMTIDQLANMGEDECYVKIRGERPHYGKKFDVTKHPNYEYAMSKKNQFNVGNASSNRIIPLRLAEKQKEQKNSELFGTDADDNKEIVKPKKKTTEERKAENKSRSEAAKVAKEALKDFDKRTEPSPEAQETLKKDVVESMGLTENSSAEDIKEAAENAVLVQFLGADETLSFTAM